MTRPGRAGHPPEKRDAVRRAYLDGVLTAREITAKSGISSYCFWIWTKDLPKRGHSGRAA